jgi:hypothetical protein
MHIPASSGRLLEDNDMAFVSGEDDKWEGKLQ